MSTPDRARVNGSSADSGSGVGGFKLVSACRGCGRAQNEWHTLLRMDPMPLAGQFCETDTEAATASRYPLTWVQCRWCELVQVQEDVPDQVLYAEYRYGSSTIPGLVRHFAEYSRFLVRRFGHSDIKVVEIGANDGVLLSQLPKSWTRIGIDPSDVAREQKSGDYALLNRPFTLDLAMAHPDRGTVDLITSSNAMAHFTDLHGAIQAAHVLLRPGGELILEVHDLAATLDGGQWDTIYHEHKVEWSERSLRSCVSELGFEATFTERLALHGGLLRCGFRSVDTPRPIVRSATLDSGPFRVLVDRYTRRRESPLYATIEAARRDGRRLAAYGASGRANVWMNQMPELDIECVFDDSPLRAGRWMPCVAVPIYPSERLTTVSPDICLVTAWNYAADIRARHAGFKGTWLQTFDPER